MEIDRDYVATIANAWARSDASSDVNERGRILEELVRYVFGQLPGLTHWKSRFLTDDGSAEFDVCFSNASHSEFPWKEPAMVVECKNTGHPIDSAGVRNFIAKMIEIGGSWAFLVASQGITGSGDRWSHAKQVIRQHRAQNVNLLVVTRADLESLRSPDHFAALVKNKVMHHSLNSPEF